MTTPREFLPRKAVMTAVGGRRRLQHLEHEGRLTRYYPLGLKRARYRRTELQRVLDDLSPASS